MQVCAVCWKDNEQEDEDDVDRRNLKILCTAQR